MSAPPKPSVASPIPSNTTPAISDPPPKPPVPPSSIPSNITTSSTTSSSSLDVTPSSDFDRDFRDNLKNFAQQHAAALVRLALHDAGTYDATTRTGGANGSIRLPTEQEREENKQFVTGGILQRFVSTKEKFPKYSYADLYQLAAILAVEQKGGPKIEFREGRKDTDQASNIIFPAAPKDATELKNAYYGIGFDDRDIVAFVGGLCLMEQTGKTFNDSRDYFTSLQDPSKRSNPTALEKCFLNDNAFQKYVKQYAQDQAAFFKDYAAAHKKMSELGFQHFPIPKEYQDLKLGLIVAATVTILVACLGYFYETMYR